MSPQIYCPRMLTKKETERGSEANHKKKKKIIITFSLEPEFQK